MLRQRNGAGACSTLWIAALMVAAIGSLTGRPAQAAEPWVRIEEDWTLALSEPDSRTHSPQLTLYLTPDANRLNTYFQLQLNHAADEGFSGGGFRVDAIRQEASVDQATSLTRAALSVPQDIVTWTLVMAVHEEELLFAVKNGHSQSWGDFGGPEYLLRMPADGIENLARYSPRQSVADIDIGFGGNRVHYLRLDRVRAYRRDGTVFTAQARLNAW